LLIPLCGRADSSFEEVAQIGGHPIAVDQQLSEWRGETRRDAVAPCNTPGGSRNIQVIGRRMVSRNGEGRLSLTNELEPVLATIHLRESGDFPMKRHFRAILIPIVTLALMAPAQMAHAAPAAQAFCAGVPATIVGGPGPDVLNGGPGNDVIQGNDGNDTIYGNGGNDLICGGPGDDQIDGGDGIDTIYGNDGNDRLRGGNGNDNLFGGAGNDGHDGQAGVDNCVDNTGAVNVFVSC